MIPPDQRRKGTTTSLFKNKNSADMQNMEVSTIFMRNRQFMNKHRISSAKPSFKKDSATAAAAAGATSTSYDQGNSSSMDQFEQVLQTSYEQAPPLLYESEQDLLNSKMNELISTQSSFQKYFVNSDLKMSDQFQVDCNRQRQRVMYGQLVDPTTHQFYSKNYPNNTFGPHISNKAIARLRNTTGMFAMSSLNGSASQRSHRTGEYNQKNGSKSMHDAYATNSSEFNDSALQSNSAIYAKPPSVNFSMFAQRKELFPQNVSVQDGLESRFNNFYIKQDQLLRTTNIEKASKRKYEVFDCQMSEIKYNQTCEIYQKNAFSNLPSKCLFDYTRQHQDSERVYFHKQRHPPTSVIDSDSVIHGLQKTCPFKKQTSPDMRKQLGREMKMNFFENIFSKSAQKCQTEESGSADSSSNLRTSIRFKPSNSPTKTLESSIPNEYASAKKLKQPNSKSFRSSSASQQRVNQKSPDELKKKPPQRNPISLFREQRRKIHKILNID